MEVRKLAAIMPACPLLAFATAVRFTDIVGYTRLMGSDEKKAVELLRKNRRIQKPIIRKYHGRWLKEMGDGILASFESVSDAVHCAGEIQNRAKKQDISLRIGIHLGEVVFDDGDVFGDGVNVASRLEELAEPGGIYVSGAIYKNVKNKEGIK
jgi:adenylate cyclase